MAEPVNRLRVFVASPGDTEEERDCLTSVVDEINRGTAAEMGLVLELVRWETHVRPGIGSDAQDVINQQLPEVDIVIGMFWKRLGTPTPRAESGTAEELEAAIERWRAQGDIEVLIYFNQSAYTLNGSETDQLQRLLAFRSKLESDGLLVWNYDGARDFEAKVRGHLTSAVRDWTNRTPRRADRRGSPPSPKRRPPSSPDVVQRQIEVTREGDVQTLVSELRTELLEQGFSGAAAARAATVLLELLANVREHSVSKVASVQVEVRTAAILCAVVEVAHKGAEFDLKAAIRKGWRDYQNGDREHGLMKVFRLASHLRLTAESSSSDEVGIECFVYDPPTLASGVLDGRDGVTPVYLEFDLPKRWRLGTEIHVGRALEATLLYGLVKPAPRLLDLYFGELSVPPDGYLAIEFVGSVLPSEIDPLEISGDVAEIYPQPRSRNAMEAALEVQFHDHFQSRRVVMHAHETGFIPTGLLQDWANRWDVPFFTDPDQLRDYLNSAEA